MGNELLKKGGEHMSNLVDNIIYKQLKKIDSKFIPKIDTLYEHVYSVLPKMNNIFDNYTEHGIDHSLRVLNYMSQLIYDVYLSIEKSSKIYSNIPLGEFSIRIWGIFRIS
jgi:hypothetical protein